jgi:hypothetical protein
MPSLGIASAAKVDQDEPSRPDRDEHRLQMPFRPQ